MTDVVRVALDPSRRIGPVRRELFGSFIEHLGRAVYDGIYEPGHPSAGPDGFRRDVIDLVRELGVTTVRYPGGNFVSGYRWEDGVGPREERPTRLDLAWHSTETNEVGLHEFAAWLEQVDGELMLAVNLGTRGVEAALDLLEYANAPTPTTLTRRRAAGGHPEPFGVRIWCLGNEMDGPWQLGHRSADDYGKLAAETARAMRQLDPNVELVVCGSSSAHMPTFGSWERTVLQHTYELVDYVSCHAYWYEKDGDTASFLASAVDMDRFIEAVVATADAVAAEKRSTKKMMISFDEWNVWYQERFESSERITDIATWPRAPRLLEDSYDVADAVVVGSLLISLLNHADRVAAASLAQLVNVIAPIMTEPGGPAWRQTTFYPFALTSQRGGGVALEPRIESPTHRTADYGEVPRVSVAAVDGGETLSIFVVNRSPGEETRLDVDLAAFTELELTGALTLADADLRARNTLDDPDRVTPAANPTAEFAAQRLSLTLPAASWSVVDLRRIDTKAVV
ncbi:alpha-N-arabinofuranosidase [Microbacterium sp. X-17]|uniref:arabinosylfuranosidase ArfA n=1 Tax=Microbacterium sp. X-17 TaxID=3144404 RepID=UPI0031F4A95F